MNLYFLSGLGADKRVFQKLRLPEQCVVHHVEWLKPDVNESLKNYATRLLTRKYAASRKPAAIKDSFRVNHYSP